MPLHPILCMTVLTYTYCADYDAAYAAYVAVRGNSGSWLASTTASGGAVAVTLDDGNGGSETISVLPGTTIVLPTPAERNNYTFEGWTAESSNEVIEAGTGVEVNSAVTYTAQWTGYGANVSFKDFDAKGANNTVDVSIGDTIYIRGTDGADKDEVVNGNYTLNDVYKSGHTFLGWDYATDEYGGDVFTARWAKDVTINAVYGESTQVTENVGEQVGAVSGSYVDVTYTSSGNITIASKDTLSVGGDYNEVVILTNKDTGEFAAAFNVTVVVTSTEQGPWFESASIEVLVNGTGTNALEGVSGNATVTYSSSDTTVATVDENTGVVTGVSAGTATITATISATDNYQAATRTYTVTVNPQTYTVTFDGNGNDGGIVPVARTDVTDGSTITEPINEPTRTGYTFIGWSATNSAEDIWDFDTDTVTGPTTLYAVWAENAHTVTFQAGDGAYFYYDEDENPVTEIEISVPKGSTIPAESIPVPVKPG